MIFIKSRGFFGLIKKIISLVFSFVYKILCAFNLHIALLIVVVGLILFLCGVFEGALAIVFYVLFGLSVVYAVSQTFRKVFRIPDKKKGGVHIVKAKTQIEEDENTNEQYKDDYEEGLELSKINYVEEKVVEIQEEKPRYFRVKQNPNYLMAEYSDRYELFLITQKGLKKIKTNYK